MASILNKIWSSLSNICVRGTELVDHSAEPTKNHESPSDGGVADSEGTLADYDPSTLCSRRHFVTELGITHEEFFRHQISENGGTLPQKVFSESTSLSSSTISRILQEMEDEEQVVRVQVGRENVVCLPEHATPDRVSSPVDTNDRLRV